MSIEKQILENLIYYLSVKDDNTTNSVNCFIHSMTFLTVCLEEGLITTDKYDKYTKLFKG